MSELANSDKAKILTHKQLLEALRKNRDEQIDGWLLVRSMLKEMHGEEMMGIEIAKLYRNSPEGSPAQRSCMQMMVRLMEVFGEKPVKESPLDNLDESELKSLLIEIIGEESATQEEGEHQGSGDSAAEGQEAPEA